MRCNIMPEIIPMKSLKNPTEISKMCHSLKEPLFITKCGFGDMVLMSIKYYHVLMRSVNSEKLKEDLANITEADNTVREDDWDCGQDDDHDAVPCR